jgi:hypothetical protein
MQAKFRHFGKVDAAKYSQLWRLQQQEACGLVRQLLAADRVIHEQQLGWQWAPPDEGIFVSPHDVVSHTGPAAAAVAAGVATLTISAAGAVEGGEEEEQEQQLHEQQQQQASEVGARVSQDGAARSRSSSTSSPGGVTGRHNGAAEVRWGLGTLRQHHSHSSAAATSNLESISSLQGTCRVVPALLSLLLHVALNWCHVAMSP